MAYRRLCGCFKGDADCARVVYVFITKERERSAGYERRRRRNETNLFDSVRLAGCTGRAHLSRVWKVGQ